MRHSTRSICFSPRAAAALLLAAALFPGPVLALGLGEIVVRSSYNKGFMAEIPVFLDQGETDLKAAVGSQTDYNMIQIGRPAFIDKLSVTVENGGGGKVIVVRSKEPITQPSFNLIVRATASGGTVLENYFLAVDFRKSLSLDLPPPEAQTAEAPKPEKKEPAPAVSAAPPPPPPPAPLPVPQVPPPPPAPVEAVAAPQVTEPAPAPHQVETPPAPEPAAAPQAPEPVAASPVEPEPVPPAPEPAKEAPSPKQAPAVAAQPPAVPPPAAKAAGEPAKAVLVKTDSNAAKNKITVKRGDTLFSIARSLRSPAGELSRAVVAIYLENKDAFIDGNIHRLRTGATLNYGNVNARAEAVSDEEARQLLSDNWKELQRNEAAEPARAASVDLPFDTAPSEQELSDFLEKWRADWAADAPGLADRYADGFKGYRGGGEAAVGKAEWIASRRAFNRSHDNMGIAIAGMRVTRAGVSFTQTFTSDQLISVGKKILKLARENGELKVAEERFIVKNAVDRTRKWTLLFPPVQSRELTVAHMQKLRGLGAVAYEAGGAPGGPYAVAVGRFATRALAGDFEAKLKSAGETDAKVVLFPFSLRMKTTEDAAVAADAMAALSQRGHFPFKVETTTAEGRTRHIVCVGAYETREAAQKAREALKTEGFEAQPVIP